MYIIINQIADHYSLGDDITKFILQYVQRNLLNQGWKSMKSFNKNTEKIKKLKQQRSHHVYEMELECFNTINNLYMENPRNGLFKFCNHDAYNLYHLVNEYEYWNKPRKIYSYRGNILMDIFDSKKVKFTRGKNHELKTEYTIQGLRNYIENRELVPKLKKSFRRNQLINIIIHNDPNYKLPEVISPRESSRLWIKNNRK